MTYKEGQFPLFQYSMDEKAEILKKLDLKPSLMAEEVDALVEWFQKQPHLVDAVIDRDVTETLFRFSKGSREKTKKRIDNLYKYRGLCTDIIQSRIGVLEQEGKIWSGSFHQVIIPKLFDTQRITVTKFVDPNPANFHCDELCRNIMMLADLRMKYDYMYSNLYIVDLANIEFGHFFRLSPVITQQLSSLTQDAMGIKINAIHILNAPSWIDKVVTFFKQFFNAKIMGRIIIHKDIETLYQVIPKKYLPKDYGGDEPSVAEIMEKTEKVLKSEEVSKYLIGVTKCVSNEKKRPGYNYDEDCLSGSFRKIEVD